MGSPVARNFFLEVTSSFPSYSAGKGQGSLGGSCALRLVFLQSVSNTHCGWLEAAPSLPFLLGQARGEGLGRPWWVLCFAAGFLQSQV